ncbi:MAG: fatty acid desaturase [Polyangiaceae bacterium]|jgi:fatty acid desaturase|nr:fatty acid desaturase [Polyangiaceae bacterium]
MRRPDLTLHALHVSLFACALAYAEAGWAVALAATGLYFACFLVAHDAMHRSLGLRPLANDLVLAIGGALVGVAGHGARTLHLYHHARPFEEGDDEGRCGHGPLLRSALLGPLHYARSPFVAWRKAPRRRRWLAAEGALVVALAAAGSASPKGRVVVAVVVALNSTIGLWGVRLPHGPNRRLVRVVERLAWLRWPVLLGVATHAAHHAAPALPAFAVCASWRRALGGEAPQARTSSNSGVLSKTARAKEQTGFTFNPCA